jgi:hypothetical protein
MMDYNHIYEPQLHCGKLVMGVIAIVSSIAIVQFLF